MSLVQVYFNLHKRRWSVRDKKTRRVIEHTNYVAIRDPRFVVSEAGRQRVLREKRKNVHAYVEGELWKEDLHTGDIKTVVTYNPYRNESFVLADVSSPIVSSSWAVVEVTDGHPVVCVPSPLRECAFCGSLNVQAGHVSAMSFAYCLDCGAQGPLSNLPDRMPRSVKNMDELEKLLTKKAYEDWNRRS